MDLWEADNLETYVIGGVASSMKFRIFDDLVLVMNFIAIKHMYER